MSIPLLLSVRTLKGLPPELKLTLEEMADLAPFGKREGWPLRIGVRFLAERRDVSRATADRHVNRLIGLKLISRLERKRGHRSRYKFHILPPDEQGTKRDFRDAIDLKSWSEINDDEFEVIDTGETRKKRLTQVRHVNKIKDASLTVSDASAGSDKSLSGSVGSISVRSRSASLKDYAECHGNTDTPSVHEISLDETGSFPSKPMEPTERPALRAEKRVMPERSVPGSQAVSQVERSERATAIQNLNARLRDQCQKGQTAT